MARKKPQEPSFPEILIVRIDQDGDETYFIADANAATHATVDESVRVGVYRLEEIAEVTAPPKIERIARPKR